jgi:tetratricopeptide (TPR) repeat protein
MTVGSPPSPLERYIKLRDAGDHDSALAAAREACAETPETPAAHYALGEACAAIGDQPGAVAAFVEVLRRAPGWADAWVNLGLARYRQGAPGYAKAAMREALRVAPNHAGARANLGALMRITGEGEGGEYLLRETLAETPDAIAARLNLAAELLQRDRTMEALKLLEEAPAPPTDPEVLRHWHLTHALAFLRLGRVEAAKAAMGAVEAMGPIPPAIAPLWHWRECLLAQLQNDGDGAEAAARRMEASIDAMGADWTPEHRLMAHYDLARFWSSRRQADLAFHHWQEGHNQLRIMQPFSRELFETYVKAITESYDAGSFRAENIVANRDSAPVFIVGMPRSGTSLTEQILSAHQAVHGAGERVALAQTAYKLGGRDDADGVRRTAGLDVAALEEAAEKYLAELHALAPDKTRIIDKMPGNELYLGLVGRMLPGAKIIHCVRDPRDIGFSIWTYRFYGEHPYAHDLGDLGWTIGQRTHLMDHWRKVLPNPILIVALEDWVNDFTGTLARVLAHLELPHDPACERFYESDREVRTASFLQVRRPINDRGIGRWRPFATELKPLIDELEAAGMVQPTDVPAAG